MKGVLFGKLGEKPGDKFVDEFVGEILGVEKFIGLDGVAEDKFDLSHFSESALSKIYYGVQTMIKVYQGF